MWHAKRAAADNGLAWFCGAVLGFARTALGPSLLHEARQEAPPSSCTRLLLAVHAPWRRS